MKTPQIPGRLIALACTIIAASNSLWAQDPPSTTDPADRPPSSGLRGARVESVTPTRFSQAAIADGTVQLAIANMAIRKTEDLNVKGLAARLMTEHLQINRRLAEIATKKGIPLPNPDTAIAGHNSEATMDRNPPQEGESSGSGQNRKRSSVTRSAPQIAGNENGPVTNPVDSVSNTQQSSNAQAAPNDAGRTAEGSIGSYTIDELRALSGDQFNRAYVLQVIRDHRKAIHLYKEAAEGIDDADLRQFATETLPLLRGHEAAAHKVAIAIGLEGPDPSQREQQAARTDNK